jgi:hypothetical protein
MTPQEALDRAKQIFGGEQVQVPDDDRFEPDARPRYTPWMTFGKYLGEPYTRVPKSYLRWVIGQVRADELKIGNELRQGIEGYLGLVPTSPEVPDLPQNWRTIDPTGRPWSDSAYWRCTKCNETYWPWQFVPNPQGHCYTCLGVELPSHIGNPVNPAQEEETT